MAKTPTKKPETDAADAEAEVAQALLDREANTDALIKLDTSTPALNRSLGVWPAEAPEPKVGKIEARVSALEAYIRDNGKALGWPEFEG